MRTLILQSLVTALSLAFGLAALLSAHYSASQFKDRRQVWLLVGVAFVLYSVNKATQEVLGVQAFFAGSGTPAYDFYMSWAAAFNHSRTVSAIFLWFVLGVVVYLRRALDTGEAAAALFAVVAGMGCGWAIGVFEGRFEEVTHYPAVAVLDTIELLLLLVVLFAMLVRDSVDRLLWIALAVYGLKLGLNAMWSSALVSIGIPGLWAPSPWQMQAYRLVLTAAMLGVVLRRVRLALRGVEVPALFEPVSSRNSAFVR